MEKIGIDTLKEAVKIAVELGQGLNKSLKDGKLTFWEGLGLIPAFKGLPQVIINRKDLIEEIKDLSPEEIEIIKDYVLQELELDGKVEEWIEWSFKFLEVSVSIPIV